MRHHKSDAESEWQADVDKEQDRLISLGEPPWVAAEQAVRNVRQRRRAVAAQRLILTSDGLGVVQGGGAKCRH